MTTRILLAAAAVQIVLAVITWWPRQPEGAAVVDLVEVEPAAIDRVTIATSGDSGDEFVLAREGSGWVVASAGNYPAMGSTVETFLDKLDALRVGGTPVASQETSWVPLGVADEDFGRRVTLSAGGTTQTLFVGTGAGSSVHIRRGGESIVWRARGMSLSDIGGNAGAFVETAWQSGVETDAITSVRIENANGTFDLQRNGETWELAQNLPGRMVKQTEVDRILRQLTSIRLTRPVANPGEAFGTAPVRVTWTTAGGGGTIEFGDEVDSDRYARRAGESHVVRVGNWATAAFRDATVDALTEEPPAPEGSGLPTYPTMDAPGGAMPMPGGAMPMPGLPAGP